MAHVPIKQKIPRFTRRFTVPALIAVLLVLPGFLSIYGVTVLTEIFIYAIFAMSLNLLVGYLGYTSLGHATFLGVGGYALAILTVKGGIENFFLGMGATLLIAAASALLLGLIAMRVSGIYFLMITLAIGQVFWALVWSWTSLTGGDDGLPGISRPVFVFLGQRWSLGKETNFYYFIFILFLICIYLFYRLGNSPFGRALVGIRNNEMRMRALGYNTWLYKYLCYVIAGISGSFAGALKVYQDGFISTTYASIGQSGVVLLMVIIGGSRVFAGPLVGALIIQLIANIVSSYTEYWSAIMGATLVFSVLFFPEGIVGYVAKRARNRDEGD